LAPKSRIVKFTQDDARLFDVPLDFKRDIIRKLRDCRKPFYPSYEAFRLHAQDPTSIKTLSVEEAEAVASALIAIARASAVWICTNCEKVIGLMEASLGQDPKAFVGYTLLVAGKEKLSCPACFYSGYLFVKPSFLISGMSLNEFASQLGR
jgi:hypothetical protein